MFLFHRHLHNGHRFQELNRILERRFGFQVHRDVRALLIIGTGTLTNGPIREEMRRHGAQLSRFQFQFQDRFLLAQEALEFRFLFLDRQLK
jgi:hypothetical protein